ncbi:MAG: hypothetical protein ACLUFR_10690 [Megamonas funiformis]|uniref:hypothetical protein n=1 Tax=Megamonas funiformis TaxID=437897 RepID=UPI003992C516
MQNNETLEKELEELLKEVTTKTAQAVNAIVEQTDLSFLEKLQSDNFKNLNIEEQISIMRDALISVLMTTVHVDKINKEAEKINNM